MNLSNILLSAALLLAFGVGINGQERPSAVLVDEVGDTCSEHLMAILDHFLVEMNNHPSSLGVIAVHNGRDRDGRTGSMITWIDKFYLKVRRFDKSRIRTVRAADEEKFTIRFWRVPLGAEYPGVGEPSRRDWTATTRLFDRTRADFNREKGRLDIYNDGFYELGCDFRPDANTFAMVLGAFPSLTGYIIVYTTPQSGTDTARRVARFAVDDLVRRHRVPRSRLKVLIGGPRENPEIEFWFVPKEGSPPVVEPAAEKTSR